MKNLATAAEQQDGAKQISAQTVKNMLTLKMTNFAKNAIQITELTRT